MTLFGTLSFWLSLTSTTSARMLRSGHNREDCGFFGITEGQCRGLGCAWDPVDPNPTNQPWCYKTHNPNNSYVFDDASVGRWGGMCTCPDGRQYAVGDHFDSCATLACYGGIISYFPTDTDAGKCVQRRDTDEGAHMKVTCAKADGIPPVVIPAPGTPAPGTPNPATPAPAPADRTDCGFNGITEEQCRDRGCAWGPVDPNPTNVPWCYEMTTSTAPTLTCDDVWASPATDSSGTHSCGDRIGWLKNNESGRLPDAAAKERVATEFPAVCGPCDGGSDNGGGGGGGGMGGYTHHPGRNCYTGHGGVDIDVAGVSGMTPATCAARCDADSTCDCVTFAPASGLCWKRRACEEGGWTRDTSYDVYVKPTTPTPAPPPTPPMPSPPPPPRTGGTDAQTTRFLSYNVLYAALAGRVGGVADAIRTVDPEIVSVQELWSEKGALTAALNAREAAAGTGRSWAFAEGGATERVWD